MSVIVFHLKSAYSLPRLRAHQSGHVLRLSPSTRRAAEWFTPGPSHRSRLPPPARLRTRRGELMCVPMVYDCDAHHFTSLGKPSPPPCPVCRCSCLITPFSRLRLSCMDERELTLLRPFCHAVPVRNLLCAILLLPISTEPCTSSRRACHFQHPLQELELEVVDCLGWCCLP